MVQHIVAIEYNPLWSELFETFFHGRESSLYICFYSFMLIMVNYFNYFFIHSHKEAVKKYQVIVLRIFGK